MGRAPFWVGVVRVLERVGVGRVVSGGEEEGEKTRPPGAMPSRARTWPWARSTMWR